MRTPANAARAFALASTLEESLYRRWPAFDVALRSNMGGYPASTLHGGGRGGSGPSDPTAHQAIHPEHDRARYDAATTETQLLQAAQLLVELDCTVRRTIRLVDRYGGGTIPPRIRTIEHAQAALDTIAAVVDRSRQRWKTYHALAGDTLDRAEAYNDLRHAVDLLDLVYQAHCEWLEGGDPIRVHCANAACPDRNPPAVDCLRCWACDRWRRRYGEERTRAAERAEEAAVVAQDRLGGGPGGDPPAERDETATEPHSASPAYPDTEPPGHGCSDDPKTAMVL